VSLHLLGFSDSGMEVADVLYVEECMHSNQF
jgi:hypothetical protein